MRWQRVSQRLSMIAWYKLVLFSVPGVSLTLIFQETVMAVYLITGYIKIINNGTNQDIKEEV